MGWLRLLTMPSVLLGGCSAEVGDTVLPERAPPLSEPLEIRPDEGDGLVDKAPGFYTFVDVASEGQVLASTTQSLCMLLGVTGDYSGLNWSYVTAGSDQLWRGGGPGTANAVCMAWSAFQRPAGAPPLFLLPATSASHVFGDERPMLCNRQNGNLSVAACRDLSNGSTFSFIAEVRGSLESTDNYVSIRQDPSAAVSNRLFVRTGNSDVLHGFAHSVFAGKATNVPARLVGFDANGNIVHGTAGSTTGTFAFPVAVRGGLNVQWMPRPEQGICGLVYVSGSFDGAERIRIRPRWHSDPIGELWRIEAVGPDNVRGSARCLALDQR
jgi:hypothetical protein